MSFVITRTRGFLSEISPEVQADIMTCALRRIRTQTPNWIIFYPDESGKQGHLEDDGRTLITTMKGLTKKVYAILDDFGSVETLKENLGKYAPPDLNTRYVVTFLLAEEY